MGRDLEASDKYGNTIDRLEEIKRTNSRGVDYWKAREIHQILGYSVWDKFEPVIQKAIAPKDADPAGRHGCHSTGHMVHFTRAAGGLAVPDPRPYPHHRPL